VIILHTPGSPAEELEHFLYGTWHDLRDHIVHMQQQEGQQQREDAPDRQLVQAWLYAAAGILLTATRSPVAAAAAVTLFGPPTPHLHVRPVTGTLLACMLTQGGAVAEGLLTSMQ
jgi:hypothetical protein